EMDLQVLGRIKRQSDIREAPFYVEAVIVRERILNAVDDVVTGAQGHVELVDLILRDMQANLGKRIANVGRIEAEVIDQLRFWRQAVATQREVEQPHPFI